MLKLNRNKKQGVMLLKSTVYGFTLIELMITVAIMGIIAAIAYPSYTSFIMQGRRADAIESLMALAVAEEKHYMQYKTYTTSVSSLASTSSDYYTLVSVAGPTGDIGTSFLISATAKSGTSQASDDECAVFTINSRNERLAKNSSSGSSADCW